MQKDLLIKLAKEEAEQISKLTGERKLRVHVVGDCAAPQAARIIGRAMVAHEGKHRKAAWTYTHAWRKVPLSAWQGARVLASCQHPEEVPEARRRGYECTLVVPKHPTHKVYDYHGLSVLPCQAQFKDKNGNKRSTCEECAICQRPDMLRKHGYVVGFEADAGTQGKVIQLIKK